MRFTCDRVRSRLKVDSSDWGDWNSFVPSKYSRARCLEREGELASAAVCYTDAGFSALNEADFESGTKYRIGLTTLLRAISADARAGNETRATAIRDVVVALIDRAVDADSRADRILDGLYYEWIGDAYLLTRSDRAATYYRTALEMYEGHSQEEFLSWGMEQEFDYARWAVQSYLTANGTETAEELPTLDFPSRIESKLEYVESDES